MLYPEVKVQLVLAIRGRPAGDGPKTGEFPIKPIEKKRTIWYTVQRIREKTLMQRLMQMM